MLLNEIPVLDNGYVATIASSPSQKIYQSMLEEFFLSKDQVSLKKVCHATLVFKAPLFVQLHLAQHGLNLVSTKKTDLGAYKPNAGEIGSSDHDTNRLIADDIARTSDALLINPTSYKADGCDLFISQIIMPVSTYATFIVSGTLDVWEKFYRFKSVPGPIRAYADAVENLLKAEWKNV